jgi:hypothetical protein
MPGSNESLGPSCRSNAGNSSSHRSRSSTQLARFAQRKAPRPTRCSRSGSWDGSAQNSVARMQTVPESYVQGGTPREHLVAFVPAPPCAVAAEHQTCGDARERPRKRSERDRGLRREPAKVAGGLPGAGRRGGPAFAMMPNQLPGDARIGARLACWRGRPSPAGCNRFGALGGTLFDA